MGLFVTPVALCKDSCIKPPPRRSIQPWGSHSSDLSYITKFSLAHYWLPKGARGGPRLQNGFLPVKLCAGLRSSCASLEGGLHSPSCGTSRLLTC